VDDWGPVCHHKGESAEIDELLEGIYSVIIFYVNRSSRR